MFKNVLLLTGLSIAALTGYGQVVTECPRNIGFENKTFTNWECYSGEISMTRNNNNNNNNNIDMNAAEIRPAVITVMPSGPSSGRHTIIERSSGKDAYGGFSTNAPNGSDYVVQLGNGSNGRGAERISYTLTVPSDVETYSIIFSYAVVFENPFNHDPDEQPKFTAKVIDLTTNTSTDCGSFEFVAPGLSSDIPGFAVSQLTSGNNANVLYKPWSPVLVNLSEYLGHTIRLEFTTNDCSRGGHFGYAYIDFNENCSIPITGNITCPDVDSIKLKVLSGFAYYRWFNEDTKEELGTKESATLYPVPPIGTKIGVELIPYNGLGCSQTLYTVIAGMDMNIKSPLTNCITFGVDLTNISLKVGNSSDLTYTYHKDPQGKIPISNPKKVLVSGRYYVKGLSSSGCFMIKPVDVIITELPAIEVTNPEPVHYPNTVDLTRTFVRDPDLTYYYFADPDTTIRVNNPNVIRLGGTFYIKGVGPGACECIAPVTVDVIITGIVIPNTFTPNGDGINDVFTVLVNSKIRIRSFRIYNRWGDTVFLTPDINNFWDGFKDNSMMPAGVYYYVMEGDDSFKKGFIKSGSVTVIR